MSDSLAFLLSVPPQRLAALVDVVSRQLDAASAVAFTQCALPGTAGQECRQDIRRATGQEIDQAIALSFRFPPDLALSAFAADHPDSAGSISGEIAVGYLYCTTRHRPDAVELCFFTISRSLAEVMRESANLRDFFRSLGALAAPPGVWEIDEWGDRRLL